MADQIEAFQSKLEGVKREKSQVEFKLQNDMEQAKALKEKMAAKGYKSLDEMKADYAQKKENITNLETKLDGLIEQIKQVPYKQPSREEILAGIKVTKAPALITPEEVAKPTVESVPEPTLNLGIKIEDSKADVNSKANATIDNNDMFSNIQNLI